MTDPTADGPGALRELDDPTSRKRFLRLGGAGIAGALAMTLAACGSSEEEGAGANERRIEVTTEPKPDPGLRRFGSGDLAIANYALTLEYIETDFYEAVIDSDLLTGEVLELARRFGEHEAQHVEALQGLIEEAGGTAIERPQTKFPEFKDQRSLIETAAMVEDLGANAYLGQAARISSPEILAAALSIHSVEARHAAALREVTGAEPAPRAFSEPADAATVLAAVRPFLA